MEKKEIQMIIKRYFKEIGFRFKGTNGYNILDNDYLIGIWLEHHPYCKAYFINFGVVYLPDEYKMPFKGWCDWDNSFLFTKSRNKKLKDYNINNLDCYDEKALVNYIEYEQYDEIEVLEQINLNIKNRMKVLYEKEFVLKYYSDNLETFASLPDYTIEKLIKLYDYDKKKINDFRKKWGYEKYDF